jgi:hypothetical protein
MELAIERNRVELDFVRALVEDLETGRLTWDDHHDTDQRSPAR